MIEKMTHAHAAQLQAEFDGARFIEPANLDQLITAPHSESYAILKDGVVLGLCGGVILYPALMQVWAAISGKAVGHGILVVGRLRMLLAQMFSKHKQLNRIEWFTTEEERLVKWSRVLGGVPEAVLDGRGHNGEDQIVWRITRKDIWG